MAPMKEMHFFRRPVLNTSNSRLHELLDEIGMSGGIKRFQLLTPWLRIRTEADYVNYFYRRLQPHHRVFGEISPSYSRLDLADLNRMRNMFEDIRPVFLMRNPVERLFSAIRMRSQEADALNCEGVAQALADDEHRAYSDYPTTVDTLTEAFGVGRVLFEFYEELFTDEALARVCDYAGIPFQPGMYHRRVHQSKTRAEPSAEAWKMAREGLDPIYKFCRARFRSRVPRTWTDC